MNKVRRSSPPNMQATGIADIGPTLLINDQIVVGGIHQSRQVSHFDQPAVFES
jgi:hypothetical protein